MIRYTCIACSEKEPCSFFVHSNTRKKKPFKCPLSHSLSAEWQVEFLAKCPFCGSDKAEYTEEGAVKCPECGCTQKNRENWNKRC